MNVDVNLNHKLEGLLMKKLLKKHETIRDLSSSESATLQPGLIKAGERITLVSVKEKPVAPKQEKLQSNIRRLNYNVTCEWW